MTTSVVNTNTNTNVIFSPNDTQSMLDHAQYLIDQGLVPVSYKTPQQIVTAISMGKNLDMDPITALNSFDVIQGTPAIKSKLVPAVLSRKGVAVKVVQDYEPVLVKKKIPIKDADGNVITIDNVVQYYKNEDGSFVTEDKEIDRVTTVKILRYYPNIGVVDQDISFYLSTAKSASWYPDKDNWRKLTSYMMMARCISRAARIAAGDYLHGLYDEFEILDSMNIDYNVDPETGEVKVLNEQ